MSVINWFEVPVADFERAKTFYETVLDKQLFVNDQRETMGSILGVFPHDGQVGGCLVHNPQYGYTPSAEGTLVYFTITGNMDSALTRVPAAGGQVLLPKTELGENAGGGYVSWVRDTEGNKVGFYSES
ncbi:MAG: VOC family protein [Chloroflexi bacterium]|nr:VOC family protein [Chloroflexota bacterium]